MSEIINDTSYTLVVIIMILAILIYGGSKKHNNLRIEYDPKNYRYLDSLSVFEKQLQKYNSSNFDYLHITNQINLSECLIPNIVDIYFINIKPHTYFDTNNYVTNNISNLMILYDHNVNSNTNDVNKNLMLLVDKKKECVGQICNNYGYYYDITKKISILDIYPIYNNSDSIINITIIIIKKSFWHF